MAETLESMPGAATPENESSFSLTDRITIEWLLYAGVLAAGVFLRLFRLGIAPMSENESAQALAALRADLLPAGGSAFLYSINAFLFSIFSASDALARIVPAIIGSALVLSPALFRDALGRFGAIGASIVLAISPIALVGSRTLSGEVVVVACALALIGLLRRFEATRDRRSLIGAAIATGVGLASGSGMYTALLALGAGALLLRVMLGEEGRHRRRPPSFHYGGLRESPSTTESPTTESLIAEPLTTEPPSITERPLAEESSLTQEPSPASDPALVKWVVGSLLAAFILAATGGLARMSGLGAAADSLSTWLGAFRATGGVSAFEIVQILFVYEIFALVVGAAGLVWVLLRSDRFGAWLGLSAILSIVIIVLQGGRQPIDLLLPVTLLALLAGYAIQLWAEAMTARATFTSDGVVFAVGAAVAGFLILQVTAFVRGRFVPTQLAGLVLQPEVTLLMLFVVLCLVVGVLLMLMYEPRTVLRGLVTLGLTALALVSLGAGWGVTQERAGDPREIILGSHVTPGVVRDLVAEAEDIAIRSDGSRFSLPVRVEVDDPVVAWYLRDARLLPDQAAAGAVTAFGQQPQGIDNAIGARFDTRLEWDPVGLDFDAWLEWVLFRTSPAYPPQVTRSVTLWARR